MGMKNPIPSPFQRKGGPDGNVLTDNCFVEICLIRLICGKEILFQACRSHEMCSICQSEFISDSIFIFILHLDTEKSSVLQNGILW
jgi:hypothetical protein